MQHSPTFAISSSGMALERTRVEVAALNLANAHTTGAVPYIPMRVVALPAGALPFATLMDGSAAPAATAQFRIEASQLPPRKAQEPGHPHADEKGFVTYPGVDAATEMVTMMSATRAYEANVAAMNTARTLALKALDIGGSS